MTSIPLMTLGGVDIVYCTDGHLLFRKDKDVTTLRAIVVPEETASLPATLSYIERSMILDALDCSKGNRSEAARQLGINRTTLAEKLKRWQEQDND